MSLKIISHKAVTYSISHQGFLSYCTALWCIFTQQLFRNKIKSMPYLTDWGGKKGVKMNHLGIPLLPKEPVTDSQSCYVFRWIS